MNDDLDAAEAGLAEGNSTFHKVNIGVVQAKRPGADLEKEDFR